jgi:Double zinc ribbon
MNTFNEKFPRDPGTGMGMEPATGGFWANLKLIRPVAWAVALILFFGMLALFWLVIWPSQSADEAARTPYAVKILAPFAAGAFCLVYTLLVGFVHVDAKRRGMRYVMWTLLAIFIQNFIGIILYFLMRDPMPTPCPKCSRLSAQSFTFCPSCGSELMRTCRVCHKKLGQGWSNCAYCGTSLTGQMGSSAPTA